VNIISRGKFSQAVDLFLQNKSQREVASSVGIAKGTAVRIYRDLRRLQEEMGIDWPKRKGGHWDHKDYKGKETNANRQKLQNKR